MALIQAVLQTGYSRDGKEDHFQRERPTLSTTNLHAHFSGSMGLLLWAGMTLFPF